MEAAVVDRIEDGLAVLLVGEDERELAVPVRELPDGSGPGVWLRVNIEDGRLKGAEIDLETTRRRCTLVQEKMDRLLKKRPGQR